MQRALNSGDIEACAGMKTHRRENLKFIVANCKDRFKLQITTTYPNMFSLELSSAISKVFVAMSKYLIAGKDIE